MARCDACQTSILFGGIRDGDYRFCGNQCHQAGHVLRLADQLPAEVLENHVTTVHEGDCPQCGGPGPVDIHTSHQVWSALVLTSWKSKPVLSCQACGTKERLASTAYSFFLGWWGFPFGLLITPIQIGKNVIGMISPPNPLAPSRELRLFVKRNLAYQIHQRGLAKPTPDQDLLN